MRPSSTDFRVVTDKLLLHLCPIEKENPLKIQLKLILHNLNFSKKVILIKLIIREKMLYSRYPTAAAIIRA